jgi:hypothetical protein
MPAYYAYSLFNQQLQIRPHGASATVTLDDAHYVDLHRAVLVDWKSDAAGRCLRVDKHADRSSQPCNVYRDLWEQYLQSLGYAADATPSRAEHLLHLRKWRLWGAQQAGFSDQQRALCYGPDRRVQSFSRAEIGGVPFRVADLDSTGDGEQKRSANSYFNHRQRAG